MIFKYLERISFFVVVTKNSFFLIQNFFFFAKNRVVFICYNINFFFFALNCLDFGSVLSYKLMFPPRFNPNPNPNPDPNPNPNPKWEPNPTPTSETRSGELFIPKRGE